MYSVLLMIEIFLYLKYDLLIFLICTYLSYTSFKMAKQKYQYNFSFFLVMISSFLINISFLIMSHDLGLNFGISIFFLILFNVFVPFFAVRKAYYISKNDC